MYNYVEKNENEDENENCHSVPHGYYFPLVSEKSSSFFILYSSFKKQS